jgi:hypothetical protein
MIPAPHRHAARLATFGNVLTAANRRGQQHKIGLPSVEAGLKSAKLTL